MDLRVFKNKNFFQFIISITTSLLGTLFLNVGLALYVLKLTGSAKIFSSVLILGVFPHLFLGPIAGVLADKFDRKKWIIFFDMARGVLCFLLVLWSMVYKLDLTLIYFTVAFISSCDIMFNPVFAAILPTIVDEKDRVDANSVYKVCTEFVRIGAPFLATLLFSYYGIVSILFVNGISFIVSGYALWKISLPKITLKNEKQNFFSSLLNGFRVIGKDKRLASVVTNAVLTHTFIFTFFALGFPYLIITIFHGKDSVYGLVEGLGAAGALVSMVFVRLAKRKAVGFNIGLGILGMCIPVFLLFLINFNNISNYLMSNNTGLIAFFGSSSFMLYLTFTFYVVFFATFYQGVVPNEKFGSFAATVMFLNALGRLAGLSLYGWLFEWSYMIPIYVFGGGMLLKVLAHIPFMAEQKRMDTQ